MFMCEKCGSVNGDVAVCPNCGAANANPVKKETVDQSAPAYSAPAYSAPAADADAMVDRGMGILAYLGIFFLFPVFAARNSKFARFHANQGLVLFLCEVAYWIVQLLLTFIAGLISWRFGLVMAGIMGVVSFIVGAAALVMAVLGIISALKCQTKELPLIGKIKLLK